MIRATSEKIFCKYVSKGIHPPDVVFVRMKRPSLTPRSDMGLELERALSEWIDASRRAYVPNRDVRDEQAEHVAWCRVKSVLMSSDVQAAA